MKTLLTLLLSFIALHNTASGQCFTKISSAFRSNYAQKADGSLWNWGWNSSFQLGNGDEQTVFIPTPVMITGSVMAFECGRFNAFVIKSDGTLWGTGANSTGNLGIGSTVASPFFVQIGTATNWRQIESGILFSFGIRTDNTLWGWGQNNEYQMGNNTCCANQLTPIQIGTASDWKQVSACSTTSAVLALKNNGTLWGWGFNDSGLLGPSNLTVRTVPTQLSNDTDWAFLDTGSSHALALKNNGTLWAWGAGDDGQTGDTLPEMFFRDTPVQIGTDTWLTVSAGFDSSYGIKSNGTLWAWGRNDKSQLGDGTTINRRQPIQIGTDTDWIAVQGGARHAIALKSNGALYAWGENAFGELGNDSDIPATTPLLIPVTGCTLDVATFDKDIFTLAPNPAKSEVNLTYSGVAAKATVSLYDLSGRELGTFDLSQTNGTLTMNTQHYPNGVYLIVVYHQDRIIAQKKLLITH